MSASPVDPTVSSNTDPNRPREAEERSTPPIPIAREARVEDVGCVVIDWVLAVSPEGELVTLEAPPLLTAAYSGEFGRNARPTEIGDVNDDPGSFVRQERRTVDHLVNGFPPQGLLDAAIARTR